MVLGARRCHILVWAVIIFVGLPQCHGRQHQMKKRQADNVGDPCCACNDCAKGCPSSTPHAGNPITGRHDGNCPDCNTYCEGHYATSTPNEDTYYQCNNAEVGCDYGNNGGFGEDPDPNFIGSPYCPCNDCNYGCPSPLKGGPYCFCNDCTNGCSGVVFTVADSVETSFFNKIV